MKIAGMTAAELAKSRKRTAAAAKKIMAEKPTKKAKPRVARCNSGRCPNPISKPHTTRSIADLKNRGLPLPKINVSGLCNYHQGEAEQGRAKRGWKGTTVPMPKPPRAVTPVSLCLCTHARTRHRQEYGEPHSGRCRDCVCEVFESDVGAAASAPRPPATIPPRGGAAVVSPEPFMRKTFKPHPAAALFPMLSEAELAELAADILANGQHEPIIITSKSEVLDGRNRLAAFQLPELAHLEPEILHWDREDDGISPTAWVISKNLRRRHLTPSQKALVAVDALPMLEAEAKQRQKDSGGDRRSVSAPVRQPVTAGKPTAKKAEKGKAAAVAGKAIGVSTRIVEQAKSLIERAPRAEIEKIRTGEKTIKQVERETKHATALAQVRVYRPPTGEYALIAVDFSWKYGDGRQGSGARSGADYPRMTVEQICDFPIPAAADCLLACWITNNMLIDGTWERVRLSLAARGFAPKQMRTWTKTGADEETPVTGLGKAVRGDTEHLIMLERGVVTYNQTGEAHGIAIQRTSFSAPRGAGSEKPARAYDDLMAICPMRPALEMFARHEREGWNTTGAELVKRIDAAAPVEPEAPPIKWRGTSERVESVGASLLYKISRNVDAEFSVQAGDDAWGGSWATMFAAKVVAEEFEAKRLVTPSMVAQANERQRARKRPLIEDGPGVS